MFEAVRRRIWWLLAWVVVTAAGCVVLARIELAQLRDAFETDARIVHRLLSQQMVQQDAVMAMLALLQPIPSAPASAQPERRLSSVYPQILGVLRRDDADPWSDPALNAAEARSRESGDAALAQVDFARGRYQLVLASEPTSFALLIDMHLMVPWSEWPMAPDDSPVRVALTHAGQSFVLQPGVVGGSGWRFDFSKRLAAPSQPFDVVAERQVRWAELPWGRMAIWGALVAAALAALAAWQRQRAERRRAEELLRLGQVARLNALGELAAGMAHELNQPLTAVLANTQAASRLLDDEPPELGTARGAMARAAEQARRAADVIGRLRRAVERPDPGAQVRPVDMADAVRDALYLLEPECRRCGVSPVIETPPAPVRVLAEPVALEQIVHNLLTNALQAMEQVPSGERRLRIGIGAADGRGMLSVQDSGPGLTAEVLARLFEPFFTTRDGGLGLGLSLCETLANRIGGTLTAANAAPRGALLRLTLPLAPGAGGSAR
ncbi:MAG: Two-component sensor PilS [Burkholderiaceae bacterium]|jgi:signal transduction histidine kinase|nr:MAG: Two-component sensor PilS [Burkholderiaceae bacterium]